MSGSTWVFFLTTAIVAALSPGPAVLFLVSQGVRAGGRKSAWAAAGILSTNAVYFALSATSIAALLLASYETFQAIKWLGAGYLIYLGLRCIFARTTPLTPTAARTPASGWRIWLNGVLVQGANPKALLFFGAVLPQFIDPDRPIGTQVFIMGATSISMEYCILLGYGFLAAQAVSALSHERYGKLINRLSGGLLIAAGLGMARLHRS